MDARQRRVIQPVQHAFQHQRPVERLQLRQRGVQLVADAGVLLLRFGRRAAFGALGRPQHVQRCAVGDAVEPRALVVGAVPAQGVPPLPRLDEGFLHGVLCVSLAAQQPGAVPQQLARVGMYQFFQFLFGLHRLDLLSPL